MEIISCPHIPKCLQSAQLLIHAVPGRAALLAELQPYRNWVTCVWAVPVVLLGGLAAGVVAAGVVGAAVVATGKKK